MVGEIWCPTLGGTSTFIGLYGALVSYCPIILLSYCPIVLLSYYPIVLLFYCLIILVSYYLIVLYSTLHFLIWQRIIITLLLYNSVG